MLDLDSSRDVLQRLFVHRPVADLRQLCHALQTGSRMSVFRRLSSLDYLSSYSHAGRYYTLRSIPQFDADGLWCYDGVGFCRDGTLKATVQRMVDASDCGRTQRQLQLRLGVRVHNTLRELVGHKQLRRESVDGEFVYTAADKVVAAKQLERRRILPTTNIGMSLELEVLVEAIHAVAPVALDAQALTDRLMARGVQAQVHAVATILARHGLEKKRPRRPSPRSRH